MDYGFYGIFGLYDDHDAAWALASEAIAKETGCTAECSRNFLDSIKGRLFAEGVIKELKSTNALKPAIDGAVAKLRRCKITKDERDYYGIPASLPYLKGFCNGKLEADTGEGWPPYTNTFV
jgi:hypothetical protein